MLIEISWSCAFADVPAPVFEQAVQFWTAVTGWVSGDAQGDRGQFVPLVPGDGATVVWLQRTGDGQAGWHLDLIVADPATAGIEAVSLGARVVRHDDMLTVLASPAGQPFCFFQDDGTARHRPAALASPMAGRSLADQLCLDIPHDVYDAECAFWAMLTGWQQTRDRLPEFSRLTPPETLPIQLLLQRLDPADAGGSRAHLDLAADDRSAEVARHQSLGAEVVGQFERWTTLRDPAGLTYCVTDRSPHD